jgi:hypothetical protein
MTTLHIGIAIAGTSSDPTAPGAETASITASNPAHMMSADNSIARSRDFSEVRADSTTGKCGMSVMMPSLALSPHSGGNWQMRLIDHPRICGFKM